MSRMAHMMIRAARWLAGSQLVKTLELLPPRKGNFFSEGEGLRAISSVGKKF